MVLKMFKNAFGFTKMKTQIQQMEILIKNGNSSEVGKVVNELLDSILFQESMKDEHVIEITVSIYNYFIQVLGMDNDAMYGHLYKLLSELLYKYGHIVDISPFFQILHDSNNRFIKIYNVNNAKSLTKLKCSDKSNKYCDFMSQQKKIISCDNFSLWLQQSPENFESFTYHLDMLLNDLISFVRNKRKECFLALVDYYLNLIGSFPKLIWEFKPFTMVLGILDQSFIFNSNEMRNALNDIVSGYQKKYTTSPVKEFMAELVDAVKWTKSEPEIVEETITIEPEELTIESAYKIAFDGFMKDGIMSEEENEALRNLRSFIPITPQGYQQVLRDCTSKSQTGNIDSGDFSKEDFIYMIMLKALEDGILTAEEKNILAKLCKAFMLDKNTIQKLFAKAKAEMEEQAKNLKNNPTESKKSELLPEPDEMTALTPDEVNKYYNLLIKEINNETKVTSLINSSSYQNQKTYKIMNRLFETGTSILSEESSNMFNIKGDLKNTDFAVTDFWYDGKEEPVVVIYFNSESIQPVRLKFRGNEVEAFFTGDLLQKMDTTTNCKDEDIYLYMYNRCLDEDIIFNGITLYENIPVFLDGLEQSNGNYKIALVDLKSMKPFKVICNEGFIDTTGLMSKGLKKMETDNFCEAIKCFETLHEQNSKMQGPLYNIGYCYKCIGMKGIDSQKNLNKAIDFYGKELDLNKNSIKTINNLGIIYKQTGDLEAATKFLLPAFSINPCYLAMLGNLTTTLVSIASQAGCSKSEINEYIFQYLTIGYQITSDGNILKPLMQGLGQQLEMDFTRLFKLRTINTKYQ